MEIGNPTASETLAYQLHRLWQRTPWPVVLLLFVVPFFVRNVLMPLAADDFSYAFIWDGEHWGNLMDRIGRREPIDSLGDILVSQWSHYFTWGGRTPSMIFIQFFAWVGKVWFDIANTAVFVMLMLALCWLSVGGVQSPGRHKGVFLWIMLCMLFGVIDYMSTMLWMTGACVYLWTGLWACLFLLLIINGERLKPKGRLLMLTAAMSGLLAGWSEEAGSLATVAVTACYLFIYSRQRMLRPWMVVGFVFLLIGSGLLMLAPGSLHREELMLQLAPEYVLPKEKLFSAEMFWDNFTEGFLPILAWESFLFIPIIIYIWRGGRSCRVLLFTAASLLVLCAMMFAPEFSLRTGFHSTMFLTVASAAALRQIAPWLKQSLMATPCRRKLSVAVGSACLFYALAVMVGCFVVEGSYRQQYDERLAYVSQHRDADSLVVRAFHIPYGLDNYLGPRSLTDLHLIYGFDLESKPTDNRSLMYALYYDLPPIRIDREVDWKKRNEN